MPCQMGKWICGPRVVNSEVTAGVGRIRENFCPPQDESYFLTIEASGSSDTFVDAITSHKTYFFLLYRRENTTAC